MILDFGFFDFEWDPWKINCFCAAVQENIKFGNLNFLNYFISLFRAKINLKTTSLTKKCYFFVFQSKALLEINFYHGHFLLGIATLAEIIFKKRCGLCHISA